MALTELHQHAGVVVNVTVQANDWTNLATFSKKEGYRPQIQMFECNTVNIIPWIILYNDENSYRIRGYNPTNSDISVNGTVFIDWLKNT